MNGTTLMIAVLGGICGGAIANSLLSILSRMRAIANSTRRMKREMCEMQQDGKQ